MNFVVIKYVPLPQIFRKPEAYRWRYSVLWLTIQMI
jgi:hypothetical protein